MSLSFHNMNEEELPRDLGMISTKTILEEDLLIYFDLLSKSLVSFTSFFTKEDERFC